MKKSIYMLIILFIAFFGFSFDVVAVTGELSLYCKYEGSIKVNSGSTAKVSVKLKNYKQKNGVYAFENAQFIISVGSNTKSRENGSFDRNNTGALAKCPSSINVTICVDDKDNIGATTHISLSGVAKRDCSYTPYNLSLRNTISKNASQLKAEGFNDDDYEEKPDVICPFCIETYQVWRFGGYAILILKILTPLIIMIAAGLDFGKAMTSGDEDAIKKSSGMAIKRFIAGIVIFFIPTILNVIFNLVSGYSETVNKYDQCISCLYKPGNCDLSGQKESCAGEYNN